jgi:hypothetical protein
MKIRLILSSVLVLLSAWFGLCSALSLAEIKSEAAGIPSLSQELKAEVFARKRDLLRVTSNWPKTLTVENTSDKEVSGFIIEIFADEDDGGPMRLMGWGRTAGYGIQTPLFKPNGTNMSILNVTRVGYFSSHRSIQEYCDRIWEVKPVRVEIN